MGRNINWLCSDWDSRDPKDDLHNVEDGKFLEAIAKLPESFRLLMQDNDMHVEITEVNGEPIVTKIIKKRDEAFIQSTESYFVYDNEGARIPLTEDEYNKLLGLRTNPDDVFSLDGLDLQSIDSENSPARHVWDVIYDSTEYTRNINNLLENQSFQNNSPAEKQKIVDKMKEEQIYSADFFPYPVDKRLHSDAAKRVAALIEEKNLTKQQLGAILGPRNPEKRLAYVQELRSSARKMIPGPGKAATFKKAQAVYDQLVSDRKMFKNREDSIFTDTDRAKLWTIWRSKEARVHGEVKLLPWQFQKAYSAKLQKTVVVPALEKIDQQYDGGLITLEMARNLRTEVRKDATAKLAERMEALYGTKKVKPIEIQRGKAPILSTQLPTWLVDVPEIKNEEVPLDLLADVTSVEPEEVLPDYYFASDDYSNDYLEETLLEGGIE